jgi:hypothetical protein
VAAEVPQIKVAGDLETLEALVEAAETETIQEALDQGHIMVTEMVRKETVEGFLDTMQVVEAAEQPQLVILLTEATKVA